MYPIPIVKRKQVNNARVGADSVPSVAPAIGDETSAIIFPLVHQNRNQPSRKTLLLSFAFLPKPS